MITLDPSVLGKEKTETFGKRVPEVGAFPPRREVGSTRGKNAPPFDNNKYIINERKK